MDATTCKGCKRLMGGSWPYDFCSPMCQQSYEESEYVKATNPSPDPVESLHLAQQAETFAPGEYLQDELNERGVSVENFATASGIPEDRLRKILAGGRLIPSDAYKIGSELGTSAEMWMGLENNNILAELRRTRAERDDLRAELERVTQERDTLQIRNKYAYEMNGDLRARLEALVEASNWVLHAISGVGKGGGRPDEGEENAAFDSLKEALHLAKDALK